MKGISTLVFAGFISFANAQTPLISHKSHSGTSVAYFIDPSSNFGAIRLDEKLYEPSESFNLRTFTPLNDSTMILETRDFTQNMVYVDTLPNKRQYSPMVFKLQYEDSIRKQELEENYQRELERKEQLQKQELESQQQLNESAPAKKKKKSYILFLFGITGGGMLLMRLFRQPKSVQPIA